MRKSRELFTFMSRNLFGKPGDNQSINHQAFEANWREKEIENSQVKIDASYDNSIFRPMKYNSISNVAKFSHEISLKPYVNSDKSGVQLANDLVVALNNSNNLICLNLLSKFFLIETEQQKKYFQALKHCGFDNSHYENLKDIIAKDNDVLCNIKKDVLLLFTQCLLYILDDKDIDSLDVFTQSPVTMNTENTSQDDSSFSPSRKMGS